MTSMFRKSLLTSVASLALAGAVATTPAQAGGGCSSGVWGLATLHVAQDSGFVIPSDGMTVHATLCEDGSAVGGGRVALILDNNFNINQHPYLDLDVGTVMTFWWSPYAWIDFGSDAVSTKVNIGADLMPIGQFRRLLLDELGGGPAALEDWVQFISTPAAPGGYDLNDDGFEDLRVVITRIADG